MKPVRVTREPTSLELYVLLDKAGIMYDVVEVFDGIRTLNVYVKEYPNEEARQNN